MRNQQWKERKIAKSHYPTEDSYGAQNFYQCLTNGTSKLGKVGREKGQGQTPTLKRMLVKKTLSCQAPLLAPSGLEMADAHFAALRVTLHPVPMQN